MTVTRLYSLRDQPLIFMCIGNHWAVLKEDSLEFVAASSAFDDSEWISTTTKRISESDLPQDYIRCIANDSASQKLAFISNDKKLWIWNTLDWTLISTRDLIKRGSALSFSDSNIIVSDKFGDVYRFSLLDDSRECILGHVSQVTDLVLTKDYIITCDVDEHIRVSDFPNSYNIHTFCLGHDSFLSKLCHINDLLVSGGGDSYICLWDYKTGTKLDSKEFENEFGLTIMTNTGNTLMIGTLKSSILRFWRVKSNLQFIKEIDIGHEILDATFDSKGQIWVSSTDGLCRIINDEITWMNCCGLILCKLFSSDFCPFCGYDLTLGNSCISQKANNHLQALLKQDSCKKTLEIHDVASDFDPLSTFYSPWTSKSQKTKNLKEWEDLLESQARSIPTWTLDLEKHVIVYQDLQDSQSGDSKDM